MIRRLRIRLVAVSMLSLFIVLTVIMGTMAVVSWQNLTDNADFTLSILEDNGGVFPKSEDFILEGRVPGKPDKIRQFSPELPYETRYFTVQLNEEGVILSTNTGRIAAIDSETAMEFARTIWEKQSTRGFLGDYRYLVHANDQGYQDHLPGLRTESGFLPQLHAHRHWSLLRRYAGGAVPADPALGADHQAGGGRAMKSRSGSSPMPDMS